MSHGFTFEVRGTELIIRVDLNSNLGPSKSGKTTMIATSSGNVEVAPGVKLGLNVYRRREQA